MVNEVLICHPAGQVGGMTAAVTCYVAMPLAAGEDAPVALEAVEGTTANAAFKQAGAKEIRPCLSPRALIVKGC